MKIIEDEEGKIKLEWILEGKDKPRRSKGKYGARRCFHATNVRIPTELLTLISKDKKATYLYEYFDKVCLVPEEPENLVSKKLKLVSSKKQATALMEVPARIFDTSSMKNAKIVYDPNKRDYSTNKKGLITLDLEGINLRKWIRRDIMPENQAINYSVHIQTMNVPEGIYLHEDLLKILDPEKLYIYELNGKFYITSIEPTIDYFQTNEENLMEDLKDYGIVKNGDEIMSLVLSLKELDLINYTSPKIEIAILPPQ